MTTPRIAGLADRSDERLTLRPIDVSDRQRCLVSPDPRTQCRGSPGLPKIVASAFGGRPTILKAPLPASDYQHLQKCHARLTLGRGVAATSGSNWGRFRPGSLAAAARTHLRTFRRPSPPPGSGRLFILPGDPYTTFLPFGRNHCLCSVAPLTGAAQRANV
jgi:hypothetical protein